MDKELKKIYLYMVIFVAIIFIGATYAFFTAGMSSETSTTVRADAGTMKITYDGGANITLSGIYPRDDVWATKNITVTGNNTTDAEMYYKLTLVVDSNTFKTSDPLQYELVSANTSTNGEVIPAIDKTDLTDTSIELGSGHFVKANNARHTYQLKIYYPNKTTTQNANQDAAFNAHVEITSVKSQTSGGITLVDAILANNEVQTPITIPGREPSAYVLDDVATTFTSSVPSTYQAYYITYGTGWEANETKFNLTGTAVTSDTYANSYSELVGKYLVSDYILDVGSSTAGTMKTTTNLDHVYYIVSATKDGFTYKRLSSNKNTTEALLASTEDDYGTSYYFRGTIKNNYVQFANKCWRVVRINGDSSVKLVLHNDNTSNAANPCAANNSTTAAFAHYNGSTYTSAFNSYYSDNAYVGFMYGTTGASDYASTHANTNKSTILTNLETWYTNNLKDYADKIVDTVWCNDKTNVTDTTYDFLDLGNISGLGYGTNKTYYGATKRLVSASGDAGGTGPSLKCNGELSKITTKIGLLTADELTFAGYAYGLANTTTYLQENATGNWWWSLSPLVLFGGSAYVWNVGGDVGGFGYFNVVGHRYGVRPSISLKSTTNVTGDGTSSSPFIVS